MPTVAKGAPSKAEVRAFQTLFNRFNDRFDLGYHPLKRDGVLGAKTKVAIKKARYYLGVGYTAWHQNSDAITEELLRTLRDPFRRLRGTDRKQNRSRRKVASKRRKARVRRVKEAKGPKGQHIKGTSPGAPHWAGSFYVVEMTRPIAVRYGHPITSTKRWPPVNGNFGSWHNTTQLSAWADDYATFNGAEHAQAIRTYWGNHAEASGTYALYFVEVDGRIFRKQTLWAVEGHYNHVHDGAAV